MPIIESRVEIDNCFVQNATLAVTQIILFDPTFENFKIYTNRSIASLKNFLSIPNANLYLAYSHLSSFNFDLHPNFKSLIESYAPNSLHLLKFDQIDGSTPSDAYCVFDHSTVMRFPQIGQTRAAYYQNDPVECAKLLLKWQEASPQFEPHSINVTGL